MRQPRLKAVGAEGVYHCMSRVVEGRFLFDMRRGPSVEADYFVSLMRKLEAFCGVQVLTYALMSNHFHLLVRVPGGKPSLSDEQLIERVRQLNGNRAAEDLRWLLANLRQQDPSGRAAEELKGRYYARMHDVSVFLKELKGRYAQWYNRRHNRFGVLWAERFKSVLVESGREEPGRMAGEGAPEALLTMAAYIDLNPIRAGLGEDPKDYRYCGYGEAVGGRGQWAQRARAGLEWILNPLADAGPGVGGLETEAGEAGCGWESVQASYRRLLFGTMLEWVEGGVVERIPSAEKARAVLDAGGRLTRAELLRCRVRYFSDGLALGSKEFLERVFERERGRFGPSRKDGARPLRGGEWGGLRVMRDLRKQPVG